jgi:hypothetical protein
MNNSRRQMNKATCRGQPSREISPVLGKNIFTRENRPKCTRCTSTVRKSDAAIFRGRRWGPIITREKFVFLWRVAHQSTDKVADQWRKLRTSRMSRGCGEKPSIRASVYREYRTVGGTGGLLLPDKGLGIGEFSRHIRHTMTLITGNYSAETGST